MTFLINDQHPTLTQAADLQAIRKSYFPNSPISYFQYLKVYKDGSISMLTDRADWIQTFWDIAGKRNDRLVYSCAKTETLDKNSFWFLWDHNLPVFPVSLAREHDIANGLTFVERHPDYYTMIAFGTYTAYEGALDYYYTNFERLRSFIQNVKETKLIQSVDKEIIHIPQDRQDQNKDLLILPKKNKRNSKTIIETASSTPKNYITSQEFECIRRLPAGKTVKQIALELKISPRTVESYFRRVMLRTGANNKRELIKLLSQIESA